MPPNRLVVVFIFQFTFNWSEFGEVYVNIKVGCKKTGNGGALADVDIFTIPHVRN